MNILYLTYDGLTDQLGQSQIIPYLSGLSEQGYNITIVSCEKKERFNREEIAIRQLLKNIEWQPVIFTKQPPVLSTLFNIWKMWKEARHVCREKRIDIIHSRSTLASLVGLTLRSKYGAKLIYDMRGFWADERVEGGLWHLKNPLYRIIYNYIKSRERELLMYSDHVISLTHEGKKIIDGYRLSPAAPVTVIPCCTDLELFNPEVLPALAGRRNLLNIKEHTFVLAYAGSIGTWYLLREMLHFFKVLRESIPDSLFLFITNERREKIFAEADLLGISADALVVTKAARTEMPVMLAIATATIFFIRPGFSKKASSPVKMSESFAMGVPVLCNSGIGDNDEIIKMNRLGWIINSFDEEAYRNAVSEMLNQKSFPTDIRARSAGIFSLKKGIDSYKEVYESLNDDTSHSSGS